MPVEAGAQGSMSDEYYTVRSGRDMYIVAQEPSPLIKTWTLFQHQYSQKKQKWYHLPLKTPCRSQLPLLFSSLNIHIPFFICTAAVHLAHTAAAVGVADSTLEVLPASGSAALLLLPSCSARPVGGADLGRTYRCGSPRPCRA